MTGESLPIDKSVGDEVFSGTVNQYGAIDIKAAKSTIITFDKTGTLTYGKPEIIAVKNFSRELSEDDILILAGIAELRSEHPLGKTIVRYARAKNLPLKDPEEFSAIPGRGVTVKADGKQIHADNRKFITEKTGELPPDIFASADRYVREGATVIYLAVDGIAAGIIALSDTLRNNAPLVIKSLAEKHLKPVLLTGDNREAALYIARELGIADVKYELLPENKAAEIQKLQADASQKVYMIGDGINDAPALKTAYTGIAMGGIGSDIAVDASDIVLAADDIKRIPYLVGLARKTLRKITVNIALSMALNFTAIILAVLGLLGPIAGALVHNAGSVLVVVNSAFLLAEKDS
jgi:P-type E1-E2 ATPase